MKKRNSIGSDKEDDIVLEEEEKEDDEDNLEEDDDQDDDDDDEEEDDDDEDDDADKFELFEILKTFFIDENGNNVSTNLASISKELRTLNKILLKKK